MVVREQDDMWARKHVTMGMKEWFAKMDGARFWRGGMIDAFVWTYSVYMSAGFGKLGKAVWITKAVRNTEAWLKGAM